MESMLKVYSDGTLHWCTITEHAESMHDLTACFNCTSRSSVLSKIVL